MSNDRRQTTSVVSRLDKSQDPAVVKAIEAAQIQLRRVARVLVPVQIEPVSQLPFITTRWQLVKTVEPLNNGKCHISLMFAVSQLDKDRKERLLLPLAPLRFNQKTVQTTSPAIHTSTTTTTTTVQQVHYISINSVSLTIIHLWPYANIRTVL